MAQTSIDVGHNAINLTCRGLFKVSDARKAEKYAQNFIQSRIDRGLRARVLARSSTLLEIQTRQREAYVSVKRAVNNAFNLKQIPWVYPVIK